MYMFVFICICMCVSLCVYTCVYVHMYLGMSVCVCVRARPIVHTKKPERALGPLELESQAFVEFLLQEY